MDDCQISCAFWFIFWLACMESMGLRFGCNWVYVVKGMREPIIFKATYFLMISRLQGVLRYLCAGLILSVLLQQSVARSEPPAPVTKIPVYGYRIVERYAHDPEAFTQGLVYDEEFLYEGTGLHGKSSLRRMRPDGTGLEVRRLNNRLFGEGVTVFRDRVIQLTWKNRTGIVWDKATLTFLKSFAYSFEGWGITHDGRALIVSDGSAILRFLDPESFKELRRVQVSVAEKPVTRLNELEFVRSEIWANVWKQDRLVRIDPESGQVTGWIDLSGLAAEASPGGEDDVLNGIAYDAFKNRIFVTGKRWRYIYAIELLSPHR